MDRTRRASKAVTDKLIKQVIGPPKEKNKEEGDLQQFQRQLLSVARDPQLNNYILDKTISKKSEVRCQYWMGLVGILLFETKNKR